MPFLNVTPYLLRIIPAWKEAFRNKVFLWKIILTPVFFFIYSALTQPLGNYFENRKGILLSDKLLYLFPSIDFSLGIFITLYISLTAVLLFHLDKPKIIWRIIEMHILVAIVRQICIYLVPLDPPTGMIVLRDVFLENTVYPHQSPMTKDLFYSGHVASIWLYFLCADIKWLKWMLFSSSLLMSFMILCMKVHYTYDVYAAFFFTTLIYFIPSWFSKYVKAQELKEELS